MSVTYKNKKFKVKNVKNSGLYLDLRKKKIDDISQIKGLDNFSDLVSLNLDENQITEITGLSSLKNLRVLSLSDNKITEIKGLENLINLKVLNLKRNQINEISGLENLSNLEQIDLSNNNISELKGLENLSKLNLLLIFQNSVFDWIQAELGKFRLAKTAVKYCALKTGKIHFKLEEVEKFQILKKEEISTFVQEKDYYKVMKVLQEVYNEVKLSDNTLYYKFLGEFLWKFPQLFEKKKFVNEYMTNISFLFSDKQGFEMETYVINNYCTYENEEVVTSFFGKIKSHNMVYKGRIHTTNFRIFAFGRKEEDTRKFIPLPFAGLVQDVVRMSVKADGKMIMGKYGRAGEMPGFGYQLPLINIVKKEVEDEYLDIQCKIGYTKFKMKIYPKQLKNENEHELTKRIKHLSSILPQVEN